MSFSTATITHTFTNADGTSASGSIKFTLTAPMTNGTTTIVPASITVPLDGSGNISQSLTSNVDTATWTLASTASSGSFAIQIAGDPSYGTLTSPTLNYNATSAQVQAALLSITGISGVTCSGGPLTTSISIAGVLGNLTLSIASSTLTGGSATMTLATSGTVPATPFSAQWRADYDILGAEQQSYFITVPAGGGTYDLGSLLPITPQVN